VSCGIGPVDEAQQKGTERAAGSPGSCLVYIRPAWDEPAINPPQEYKR